MNMNQEIDVDGICVYNVKEGRPAEIYRTPGPYTLTLFELCKGLAIAGAKMKDLQIAMENTAILIDHFTRIEK